MTPLLKRIFFIFVATILTNYPSQEPVCSLRSEACRFACFRIFTRSEINEVFLDNELTVNCFSLDYGHKFSTTINDVRPLPKALTESRLPFRTCYIYLPTIAAKDLKTVNELKYDFEDFVLSQSTIAEAVIIGCDRNFNLCGDVKFEDGTVLSSVLIKTFKSAILTVEPRMQFRNHIFSEIGLLKLPKQLNGSDQSELLFNQIRNWKANPNAELKSYRKIFPKEVERVRKPVCEHEQWDELYDLINLNDFGRWSKG